jgi:hypothetical protein
MIDSEMTPYKVALSQMTLNMLVLNKMTPKHNHTCQRDIHDNYIKQNEAHQIHEEQSDDSIMTLSKMACCVLPLSSRVK